MKPLGGYEDFACHADPDKFYVDMKGEGREEDYYEMTPEEFAYRIKNSTTYKGGDVRIISCQAGEKLDGAAQKLADALGVNVYAPTELVSVDENGEMFVSNNEVLADIWYTANDRRKIKETGKWIVFRGRKDK